VGYLAYDAHAADLLFQVVSRRYEQKSIVITTNLPFKQWDTVFPNAACASLQLCCVESLFFSTARGSPCRSRTNRRPMSLQASDLAEAAHGKLSRAPPFHLTV
jgi:hypothetical protein